MPSHRGTQCSGRKIASRNQFQQRLNVVGGPRAQDDSILGALSERQSQLASPHDNAPMLSPLRRRRSTFWSIVCALVLVMKAGVPVLAATAAFMQGKPVAEICAIYGVRTSIQVDSAVARGALHAAAAQAQLAHAGHVALAGHEANAGHLALAGHDAHAGHDLHAGHVALAGHDAHAAHDAHARHDAVAEHDAHARTAHDTQIAAAANAPEPTSPHDAAQGREHCALTGLAACAAPALARLEAAAWLTSLRNSEPTAAPPLPVRDASARWLSERIHAPPFAA